MALTARRILDEYWSRLIEHHPRPYPMEWLFRQFHKMLNLGESADAGDILRAVRQCHAYFYIRFLGIIPWTYPKKPGQDHLGMIENMQRGPRSATTAGHKVSKSLTAVGSGLAHVITTPRARVPITSSSFLQIRKIIWYELEQLYLGAQRKGIDLGGTLYRDPSTGLVFGDGREMFGFTTDKPERAAGISGPGIYYEIDEASGVADELFEPLEGNMAGGAKIAMFSQGTRQSGYFYDAFHGRKADLWLRTMIPSWHSPNCQAEDMLVPGLATLQWVEERLAEWGEENPVFIVRVGGGFPPQGPNSVFPVWLVEDCKAEYRRLEELGHTARGDLSYGVDPGFEGDDEMVIYPVRGRIAFKPIVRAYIDDGNEIARLIVEDVRQRKRPGERVRVNVDMTGEGRACLTGLNGLYRKDCEELLIDAVGVRVGLPPDKGKEEEYFNLRAQLAFGLKDWMKQDGAIPEDTKLEGECTGCVFITDEKMRRRLPKKPDEKKLYGRSPDRRNALELAVYKGAAGQIEFQSTGKRVTHTAAMHRFLHG